MSAQTHEFQTEVKQLLDLMIHSLYSHKDVFLRELISNASDAADRLRFAGLTRPELLPDQPLRIQLRVDPEARTLSVEDNGIGMSREEVIANIGTIARSGSVEFLKTLEESQKKEIPPELIGQFGVGFYASFMVADRVSLVTRKAGETEATRWESTGDGGFEVDQAEREAAGTSVTLHLRAADADDGLADFTDEFVLRQIVKRYSDFVAYPIHLEIQGAEIKSGEEPLNSMKAIWTRPAEEIEEGEYKEFYKHISHDWNDPLLHLSTRIEGNFEARALLFVPGKAPFDLYHREMAHRGIQLYVKRVFIMDECRELMPDHLRFIKGVVDAEEVSLNVSREMLQQDRQIQIIRNHLVKKVLESLADLKTERPEEYLSFWNEFGPVLKEGLLAWGEKKERILGLMLVASTHHQSELSGLEEVVSRMGEDQDVIYYMTGPSRQVIESSPHLEVFREKGIEVLFFTDHVDEVWLQQNPPEYQGKRWKSVGTGELELGSEEEKKQAEEERERQQETYKDLIACIRAAVQEDVKEVRLSSRLTSSPACLVLEEGDITPKIEEMLRQAGQEVPPVKRILELNPDHPLLAKLQEIFQANGTDPRLHAYAELLYGQAVLAEGGLPADPAAFGRKLTELMLKALSI
jgi:molecular chaperone HtpG